MTAKRRIEVRLVEGPFKCLQGRWEFTACGDDGCRVALALEFAFSSVMLQKLLSPVFAEIAHSMVDSFCGSARELYGQS